MLPRADETKSIASSAWFMPIGRWNTIVLTEPCSDWDARLDAVLPACRHPASLLVLVDDRDLGAREIGALRARTSEVTTLGSGRRRLIAAKVR